eukprot:1157093-Pelagomonas_calceolata.AAC.4
MGLAVSRTKACTDWAANAGVNQKAQRTDAGQLSRNLLLAPKATVNVKPNLMVRGWNAAHCLPGARLECSALPAWCVAGMQRTACMVHGGDAAHCLRDADGAHCLHGAQLNAGHCQHRNTAHCLRRVHLKPSAVHAQCVAGKHYTACMALVLCTASHLHVHQKWNRLDWNLKRAHA